MASLSNDADGTRRVLFMLTGRRRTLRIGKLSQRDAERIRDHLENLVKARTIGATIPTATAEWLRDLGPTEQDKLTKLGLIEPVTRTVTTLGAFTTEYIDARPDLAESSREAMRHAARTLTDYFGRDRDIATISPGDAREWRSWVEGTEKLADGTARRRTGYARQFFAHAVRKGLIGANPFDGLAAVVRGNPDRFYFVSAATARRVLDACPTVEWKLLFGLARWLGLRIPSEALALTWADVNWEANRIKVTSPKTARHPGHASRLVPMFPEVAGLLQEAFDAAPDGTVYVLNHPTWRAAGNRTNLRTMMTRYIEAAGLTVWPKLWVNCRATRAVELRQQGFPDHVVNAWLGHAADVAAEHYLRVTEADFERATGAAQNPAHSVRADARQSAQGDSADDRKPLKTPEKEELALTGVLGQSYPSGLPGLEPGTL